jgi:hypothetical protein
MNEKEYYTLRVAALDPISRGLAYAVLEGPENLVDWGIAHARLRSESHLLVRAGELLDRYVPDFLVLEDGRGTKRRERAKRIIKRLEKLAKSRKLPVIRVSRSRVRQVLAPARNKQDIALALASMFPEIAPRLPRVRKPWMPEDERMNIFDAVSFAIAALTK